MFARLEKALWAVGTASALMLCSLAPAQAAVYTGKWDPAYGAPFNMAPDVLGWKGSAVFEIPETCIVNGTVTIGVCPAMAVKSAQVTFYDFITEETVATLDFAGSGINVLQVSLADGELTWIASQFSLPANPTSSFADINDYSFYLQFRKAGARMYHTRKDGGEGDPEECIAGGLDISNCGFSASIAEIEFQRVPEPGSLALVLAALGAGWAVRRRRA